MSATVVSSVAGKNKRVLDSDDEENKVLTRKKFKSNVLSEKENNVNDCYVATSSNTSGENDDNDLEIKVNLLKSKLSLAECKLRKAEMVNKSLNADLECKIEEKDRLISNLQLFIDEQKAKSLNRRTPRKKTTGSNSSEDFDSLNNLILDLKTLQADKSISISKNSELELEFNEIKSKYLMLQDDIITEYIPLHKFNTLRDELELLKQNEMILKRKQENNLMNNNLVNEVRNEMRLKEREHFDAITKLHEENHTMRKKLNAVENKYTILAFTPPKVKVKEVVDVDTEEKLDELKLETLEYQCELRKCKRELEKLNENNKSLAIQNDEFKVKDKKSAEEISTLKKQYVDINKQLMEKKLNLDNELRKKDYELSILKESNDFQERSIKQKMQAHIEEYSAKSQSKQKLSLHLKEFMLSLNEFKTYKTDTEKQLAEMKTFFDEFSTSFKHRLITMVEDSKEDSNLLAKKYAKEIQLRKKLHNQLVELKGNIRVLCRVRPMIKEDGQHASNVITFNDMDDSIIYVDHKSSKKKFEVDKVFQQNITQYEIFEEVKSLVISCLDGYSVCIFAYGQTGSGKTYTMEGTKENPGINQQALQLLFQKSAELNDWNFQIFVSFVEIYNETLIDLLSDESKKLEIKQHGKDGIHVPGLTQINVSKLEDVNKVFTLGRTNRSVASTSMNERSSRSHSVLSITILGNNVLTGTQIEGKLNLVDLAGSERVSKSGSEGIHLKEAQCINKSLSALGDVIHALKNKNQHIPYRNTKLTYLLQNCLSRESKTLMMVQLSPVDKNSAESFCSLDFAQRVRSVELGKSSRAVKKNLNL